MSGILFAITPQISIILHCNFHKTMFTKIEFKKYVHKVVGGPEVDL